MPKGDREILKADPEDGTTPIANLLLEALIIAKLTSKERAAVLFLIRRTYGWQVNGSRLKEAKIPFKQWTMALSMDSSHTSTLLTGLEQKGIIKRRYIGPTGIDRGYYYSINTMVAEWSNSCLNRQLLRDIAIIELPKSERKVLPKSVTTSRPNYTHGKKLKEILNKDDTYIKDNNTLISGQSIEQSIRIARGELPGVPERIRKFNASELDRLGISWQERWRYYEDTRLPETLGET